MNWRTRPPFPSMVGSWLAPALKIAAMRSLTGSHTNVASAGRPSVRRFVEASCQEVGVGERIRGRPADRGFGQTAAGVVAPTARARPPGDAQELRGVDLQAVESGDAGAGDFVAAHRHGELVEPPSPALVGVGAQD